MIRLAGRWKIVRRLPVVLLVALLGAACTYSSNDRAEDLASATPTSPPTETPATTPVGTDESGDAETDGSSDDGDADDDAEDDADGDAVADPTAPAGWVVVENVNQFLNVREGPGVDFPVIDEADLGTVLATTGRTEADWVEVIVDDSVGWVSANFIATTTAPEPTTRPTPTPLPTPTPVASGGNLVVDAPLGLNLRAGPSTDAAIIRELDDGTVVIPTGETQRNEGRTWVEIRDGSETGWVVQRFLRVPDE